MTTWITANLDTVELNASFYRLPPRTRFEAWAFHVGRAHPEPCSGREALDHWARRLAGTEEAYVYFNNDPKGCALRDARRFALAAARHGLDPTRVAPASLTPVDA